jgi:hypothetical protein
MESSSFGRLSGDLVKWMAEKIDLALERIDSLDSSSLLVGGSFSNDRLPQFIPSLYKYAIKVVGNYFICRFIF